MKNINLFDSFDFAFLIMIAYGIYLEKYYHYFGNSNFLDNKMPERACSLFNNVAFFIFGIYELFRGNYWIAYPLITFYSYCIYVEITSNIPRAIRLENVKNKKEIIYIGCGRKVLYEEYKDW
ncbi:MAG: hypothetical protein PHZ26_00235 [Candidatus Gracilibacteria bacterium]|nr:hypothetical protein [Candidatus Gracilibacteria bacterium]MDD2908164.1 hypothetical protein [Candidatus Gracilibacteria bacterium]